jgi:hypothetical protein
MDKPMTDQQQPDQMWRMAFVFDAADGDQDRLRDEVAQLGARLPALPDEVRLRAGVVDHSPEFSNAPEGDHDTAIGRTLDAAIELTFPAAGLDAMVACAPQVAGVIETIAAPGSIEVMAGPMFAMVPQRDGDTILSLAFVRYPGTTSKQFRDWWRQQHAPLAIRVLGPGLLAYDQVHVDLEVTEALSAACGHAAYGYDAYDNLTWASPADFVASLADAEGMAALFRDEADRIDNDSRRHAMLRRIAPKAD